MNAERKRIIKSDSGTRDVITISYKKPILWPIIVMPFYYDTN